MQRMNERMLIETLEIFFSVLSSLLSYSNVSKQVKNEIITVSNSLQALETDTEDRNHRTESKFSTRPKTFDHTTEPENQKLLQSVSHQLGLGI